ncbi:MAG: hypothetical protein IJ168_02160 [Eubacterium sp.]|nr:hypothetical protein [Eubacterium sp.]
MYEKVPIIVRFERDDLRILDSYVAKAGLSREEYIRQLCGIVTRLDCKPSDVEKLKRAYEGTI